MAKVQFFTQAMIDAWAQAGKVDFDGRILRVLVEPKRDYVLIPATRFLDVIEGEDQSGVLRKILNEKHLKDLGADVYRDSAIIGEVAYQVEPGFVVDQDQPSERIKDEALLADFLLKNL